MPTAPPRFIVAPGFMGYPNILRLTDDGSYTPYMEAKDSDLYSDNHASAKKRMHDAAVRVCALLNADDEQAIAAGVDALTGAA